MDISVPTVTVPHECGILRCGQCESCRWVAMVTTRSYVYRQKAADALVDQDGREEDPDGVLLELLKQLGLKN